MHRRVLPVALPILLMLATTGPLQAGIERACTDCIDPRLLSLLPDDAQYHRAPVADDRNGFLLLRQASEALVDSSSPIETSDCTLPDDATRERIRAWVSANQAALALFDAALGAPEFQLPLFDLDTQWAPYRMLVRLKLARATLRMMERQWNDAARDLVDAFLLGQRMLDGDPVLLTSLVGSAFQGDALRGMRRLASLAAVPDTALAAPMNALERAPDSCDAFARSLRVELTTFLLPWIVTSLPAGADDAQLVDLLLNPSCTPKRRCRSTLRSLLGAHPRPFDADDTVRVAGRMTETMIKRCGDPTARRKMIRDRDWSEGITGPIAPPLHAILDAVIDGGRLTTSTRQIDRAVAQFAALPNPLGRRAARSAAVTYFPTAKQAERNATLTFLAIRRYEHRNGRMPHDLEVLVDNGLLATLPNDPYGAGPLRYDPTRRLLWSLGEDGVDDGGAAATTADASRGDLSWTIPAVDQHH